MRALQVASSSLACVPRWPMGMYVGQLGPRPEQRFVLYEFEACPYCRKVREALTMLDLEVEIRPCPKGGERFRPAVVARGKSMFPFLVDDNTGEAMWESNDIVAHLYRNYGVTAPPLMLRLGPLTNLLCSLAGLFRPGFGYSARPSREPALPLELWSFDISPFCRLVREELSALELPHILHNVGKRSPSRPAFVQRSGRMMVPYLLDPNTGAEMFESAEIVDYLRRTYGKP
ncbi:MAG TPA: glutathione S-transferase N-terminal domain-containing protein [Myxococcota bacterium]|nr:glutathione S-transferase N-terminal domain-containing protein [Myxococcota bacterium]